MARGGPKKGSSAKRLSDFLKEKAAGEPLPVYVLRGTDPYLLHQGRQAVRQRVFGNAEPDMALLELEGAEAQIADVLDALRTAPFLAPRRLVFIREADAFFAMKNQGDKNRDALLKYLEAPAPTGSLCLEVASWNESTRLAKRVEVVGVLIQCEADRPGQIPSWLQTEAKKRHGKSLSFGAAQMLQQYLGDDFASLTHAIEMLALYVGDAARIDTPEVDALIARGHHERVWDLCDAVAEHRVPQALGLLDTFWTEGMPAPQIIGILRSTFRQLVRVRAFSRHMSMDAALDRATVPRGAFSRVRRAVEAFTDADLADAYQALVDTDLEIKTRPDDRLAMEALVHRLCNPGIARTAGRDASA